MPMIELALLGVCEGMAQRRRFLEDFKFKAVREVLRGAPPQQVAGELQVHENVLRRWVCSYRKHGMYAFPGNGRRIGEEIEIVRLKREIKRLNAEREILNEGRFLLDMDVEARYAFVVKHRKTWPIKWMCEALAISRTGFYEWRDRTAQGDSSVGRVKVESSRSLSQLGWVCYHVYYDDESLLSECAHKLLGQPEVKSKCAGFFFLRHWKNGPHFRLRFKFAVKEQADACKLIEAELNAHLSRKPSLSNYKPAIYAQAVQQFAVREHEVQALDQMVANNTVRREPYVPEYEKYGGSIGVQLAESIFSVSSKIVCELLSRTRSVPSQKLGNSFTMMNVAVNAFGIAGDDARQFFANYFRYWNTMFTSRSHLQSWAQLFSEKRESLLVTAQSASITSVDSDPLIHHWDAVLHDTAGEIDRCKSDIYPHIKLQRMPNDWNPKQYLLMNYIHTHNNRYGIKIHEEALLGYLCMRTSEALMEA